MKRFHAHESDHGEWRARRLSALVGPRLSAAPAPHPQAAAVAHMPARGPDHVAYRGPLPLAGLQIVLGYAWLVAGVDKALLAGFPAMLGSLLSATVHGGMVPAPFAAFLIGVVVPHGAIFGVLTEWGEQLTGLGLLAAGLTTLLAGPLERRLGEGAARLVALSQRVMNVLWPLAAMGGLIMGLSFYAVDGAPWQGFMPSVAFGGALDEGFLLAMGSLVLLMVAIAPWLHRLHQLHRSSSGRRPRPTLVKPQAADAPPPPHGAGWD